MLVTVCCHDGNSGDYSRTDAPLHRSTVPPSHCSQHCNCSLVMGLCSQIYIHRQQEQCQNGCKQYRQQGSGTNFLHNIPKFTCTNKSVYQRQCCSHGICCTSKISQCSPRCPENIHACQHSSDSYNAAHQYCMQSKDARSQTSLCHRRDGIKLNHDGGHNPIDQTNKLRGMSIDDDYQEEFAVYSRSGSMAGKVARMSQMCLRNCGWFYGKLSWKEAQVSAIW